MNPNEIVASLARLTASWTVRPTQKVQALDAARRALAASLGAGIAPAQHSNLPTAAPSAEVLAQVGALIGDGAALAKPAGYGFVQAAAALDPNNPSGMPAWARGMQIVAAHGPFIDAAGVPHVVNIVPTLAQASAAFGDVTGIFGVFPVLAGSGVPGMQLTLGAGSVWFDAQLLVPSLPTGSWCGFLIAGGTLTAPVPFVLLGDVYLLPPGVTALLTATLAPPATPPGTGTGPGQDAIADTVQLPNSVTLLFGQTGSTVQALDPSGATLYGTSFTLTRSADPVIAFDNNTNLLVPCTASSPSFSFASVASSDFVPSGTAAVVGSGWVLPIAQTTPQTLGAAAGAGSLLMGLGGGAAAHWRLHPVDAPVAGWQIFIDPTKIVVLAGGVASGPAAVNFTLWPEAPPSTRSSSVTFTTPSGFLITFVSTAGTETLLGVGRATAHLDRPLAADGMRYGLDEPASIGVSIAAAGTRVTIFAVGTPDPNAPPPVLPLALENALIGVTAPASFLLFGAVTGASFTQCNAIIFFDAKWLLPTLPDPYASTFGLDRLSSQTPGAVASLTQWNGELVRLDLALLPANPAAGPANVGGVPSGPFLSVLPPVDPATGVSERHTALLDLSTKADLFGVTLSGNALQGTAAPTVSITGVSLEFNGALCATFALPQVSWEPMESTGPTPPLGPIFCNPPSDGPPLLLQAPNQQQLVPLSPAPVLLNNISNVAAGQAFTANFSLPFGLIATINQPNAPPVVGATLSQFAAQGGEFALNAPLFAGSLAAALQLTLKPAATGTATPPVFPGYMLIDNTGGAAPGQGYGYQVMGAGTPPPPPLPAPPSSVAQIFQNEFGPTPPPPPPPGEPAPFYDPGVPLERIDLSGYGASIFSEWNDDVTPPPKVTKVHFETMGGRTAFEVIQVETVMYHYGVVMVRTIIMERQAAGWVQRTDSGWKAASDGIFNLPNTDFVGRIHRGAVGGVFNVRNVREVDNDVAVPPGSVSPAGYQFRQVLFDADIGLDQRVRVLQGGVGGAIDAAGNPVTLVPARDLVGYIQLGPDGVSPDSGILQGLFEQTGPISAKFSCVAQIGALGAVSGTTLRCAAIEGNIVSTTTASYQVPALGCALRAAPVLPHDGAWGFGQRKRAELAPSALQQDFPVPIVTATGGPNTWYIADIADMLGLDAAATRYGILQNTGTQKLLFEQPEIPHLDASSPPGSVPGIVLPTPPNFADVASLLTATGLFPDLANTIGLDTSPVPDQLQNAGDGLKYSTTKTFGLQLPALVLLDLGVLQVALAYSDVSRGRDDMGNAVVPTRLTYVLDPAAAKRWSFKIENLSFLVFVPEFSSTDALLTVVGDLVADDQTKPTLQNLKLVYGAALDALKSIFSRLQALAQFLPGGAGAGLTVALADGRLTVSDVFNLPTLPLGLGELSDVGIDVGFALQLSPLSADFSIGIGGPDHPFNWIVSPLAGTGLIDIGVKGGKPELTVQAGIGLGLAIDLAIASGSASVTIAVQLDVTGSAITVMFILTGQAAVDVLDGLASVALTLTAAVGVSVDPLPIPQLKPALPAIPTEIDFPSEMITFLASVSVGIHISICWVVNVDFDGSWQFSQSVQTPAITVAV